VACLIKMETNRAEFSDLNISTMSVMCYGNLLFNIPLLKERIPVHIPSMKENEFIKLPYAQKLSLYPYASIINKSMGDEFYGWRMRPKKKKKKKKNNKGERLTYFRNQLSLLVKLRRMTIHIMIFNCSIKIVGCKRIENAFEVFHIVLQKYIIPLHLESPLFKIVFVPGDVSDRWNYIIVKTMCNYNYGLLEDVDKMKVNDVFNEKKYENVVHESLYEPTSLHRVSVKLFRNGNDTYYSCDLDEKEFSEPPEDFAISFFPFSIVDQSAYNLRIKTNNSVKKVKSNNTSEKYNSFMIVSSTKIIQSSRNEVEAEWAYNQFMNIIEANIDQIKELTY
jgi:hypothetical protein